MQQDTHNEIRESIFRFLYNNIQRETYTVQYQQIELTSRFDEYLLQWAETFNMN